MKISACNRTVYAVLKAGDVTVAVD